MKILLLTLILSLSSCVTFRQQKVDCSNIENELKARYDNLSKLSIQEIQRRKKIDLPTVSRLDEESVFSKIVAATKGKKSELVMVDLRFYHDVSLGNIIVSNLQNEELLNLFLLSSKYSQGNFALINLNQNGVFIVPPKNDKIFSEQKIVTGDFSKTELVFAVNDSRQISGNMKFTAGQKISLLASNIKIPYRVDLREASNLQFHMGRQWIMSVYDISGSEISGGKDTAGFFQLVNNKNVRSVNLQKFNKSTVACYADDNKPKLQ